MRVLTLPLTIEKQMLMLFGQELVELSLRAIRGEIKPVMSKFDCKMIEVLPTSRQPMRDFVDKLMSLEHKSLLSVRRKLFNRTSSQVSNARSTRPARLWIDLYLADDTIVCRKIGLTVDVAARRG
jgi:hypothetical protein